MAKRRDRRVAPSSDHRRTRADTATGVDQFEESSAADRKLIFTFIFFFIIIPGVSVLVYSIKYGPKTNDTVTGSHTEVEGLFETDLTYLEILAGNYKVSSNESHRRYTYPVLAYITPWNSKGYEMAKRFTNKFTHLCPVWYNLKSQGKSLALEGRDNADQGWISELRRNGDALVLPRVVLEALPMDLLRKKKLRDKAIKLIVSESEEMVYDGIVLESWSTWTAYGVLHDPAMRNKALEFIKQLGNALHSVSSARDNGKHLQLIYVIGPPRSEKLQVHDFGPDDLQRLTDAVDGFSLMTYDFSGPPNPGPNAPLKWIRFTLKLLLGTNPYTARTLVHKIFLGINFYGNDFVLSGGSGGGAITGRDYLSLLEKHKPKLQWENNSAEHFFLYVDDEKTKHAVFYPTLTSVSMRLEEAGLWGCGISIWEIGQGLIPASVLCERRRMASRISALPTTSSLKFSASASSSTKLPELQECLSRAFNGGLILLSSVLSTGLAKALTYEGALEQTVGSSIPDIDLNGVVDRFIRYSEENPTVIAGVTALAVPLVLFQALKSSKPWGVESARKAYEVLGDDVNAQLLDIRAPAEFRQVGAPDVRGLSKKPVSIFYKVEDKQGFLKKLSLKFKEPESTTLIILDKYDGNSEVVAELVTVNGFKAAYAIKDGAEGPRGWMNSGLPWSSPKKVLSLDALTDGISSAFEEGADALPVTLGIAVAAGLGALAFSEVETILQLLGSAAIIQFASKKLLFAEDRKKTLEQVDEFLNTKVAPIELVDEVKQIGSALLPTTDTGKGLPAPPEAVSEPPASDNVQKSETLEEPPLQINSVPKVEVKAESESKFSDSRSPYPYYPDLKPPSSPSPSQP
ncbi:hypothetical protein K2173_003376 [Erythroxylum novogranatense]|uniref:Chitinase domain-containing protein 1 n=1 Tax=Erythroxylum novogranatense TaxID=1862640 RepID=A0AAV8S8K3_9ROSI|nr:hypothetical protein K2173_003376 [Erythroxylum novogranatense]